MQNLPNAQSDRLKTYAGESMIELLAVLVGIALMGYLTAAFVG
jgi:hypothetical protein